MTSHVSHLTVGGGSLHGQPVPQPLRALVLPAEGGQPLEVIGQRRAARGVHPPSAAPASTRAKAAARVSSRARSTATPRGRWLGPPQVGDGQDHHQEQDGQRHRPPTSPRHLRGRNRDPAGSQRLGRAGRQQRCRQVVRVAVHRGQQRLPHRTGDAVRQQLEADVRECPHVVCGEPRARAVPSRPAPACPLRSAAPPPPSAGRGPVPARGHGQGPPRPEPPRSRPDPRSAAHAEPPASRRAGAPSPAPAGRRPRSCRGSARRDRAVPRHRSDGGPLIVRSTTSAPDPASRASHTCPSRPAPSSRQTS